MAVSYDPVAPLARFARDRSIAYLLLSDEGSRTIRAYGVEDQDGPGTFLIDRNGVIGAALFLEGYRQRHDTESLIGAATSIDP